jgi:hypothetical protein
MTSTNEPNSQVISHSTKHRDSRSEDHKLTTRTTHPHKQEINSDTDRCITICRGDAPPSRRGAACRRPQLPAGRGAAQRRAEPC